MNRFFSLPQFIGLIATTVLLLTYRWLEYAPYFALCVILLLVAQFIYIASIENKKKAFNSFKLELDKNINNHKWLQNKKDELKDQLTLKVGNAQINRLKLEKIESILSSDSSNNIEKTNNHEEVIILNKKISELEKEIDGHRKLMSEYILVKPLNLGQDIDKTNYIRLIEYMYLGGILTGQKKDVMTTMGKIADLDFTTYASNLNRAKAARYEAQKEIVDKLLLGFNKYCESNSVNK